MREEWDFIRGDDLSLEQAVARARTDVRPLSAWLAERIAATGLRRRDVVRDSRLNQTFCYQIIAGTRRASRDKLVQLAFGMHLGVYDACELLERGGASALVPRCPRDVVVAFCLERDMGIEVCDDLLWAYGQDTLVSPGTPERGGVARPRTSAPPAADSAAS